MTLIRGVLHHSWGPACLLLPCWLLISYFGFCKWPKSCVDDSNKTNLCTMSWLMFQYTLKTLVLTQISIDRKLQGVLYLLTGACNISMECPVVYINFVGWTCILFMVIINLNVLFSLGRPLDTQLNFPCKFIFCFHVTIYWSVFYLTTILKKEM